MSDDKTKKKPLDSSRINIHEPYEVNYWCDVLGCTETELKNAVSKVGTSVTKVKEHLGK
ncbi:DUF3606 domain-containing protein [Clostridium beijerinckii]|uniref:DUF3606 domain-containing protein n=1 Tax=Clostridium beijerinckii TaxID=1520 RepID=A0A7X9XRW2_CLOBE|nr:DUF3606 domain-containing protein [Clostridium beijerinckii]NMF07863.1 DUF3606 domain-containing protein [Clostridium beijerinckii]